LDANRHDRLVLTQKYDWLTAGERILGKMYLESSRGCPFPCIFCTTNKVKGKDWRGKSPRRILEEHKRYREFLQQHSRDPAAGEGKVYITFVDDNFSHDKDRVYEFCDLLSRLPASERPLWSAMCRALTIKDRELTQTMAQAGCVRLYLGAE